ncbi:MAG: hypothetical protein RXR82_06760 [Nitrososphaeria archaeon]
MLRITGVVVCGARALRSGVREAYIYRLTEEGCPRGALPGDSGCVKKTVRSLDRPIADASDYTNALARVILPADAEGIAALEAARPGAIFEITGQDDSVEWDRGVGEEVEFGDAVVTPLPGPAPREVLQALEITVTRETPLIFTVPLSVPVVIRGVASTPVRGARRSPFSWFMLEISRRHQPALPVVLWHRRADELPTIAPGATIRAACVHIEFDDPWRLPAEVREALWPGSSLSDLPDSAFAAYGGPETAVMVV